MSELAVRSGIVQMILLKLLGLSDKILVQTEVGAREFPPTLSGKIEVIPGYRPRSGTRSLMVSHNDDTIRFVYVGSVTKVKGIDTLLTAFSELRTITQERTGLELHVYGVGSTELVRQLQSSPGVYYYGKVDNADLRGRLVSYDVFLLPSKYSNEGHSGALIEALMSGLPVIVTDLPALREVVVAHSNGILVEPGNVQQLVEAMELLASNAVLRQRLAEGALLSSTRFDAELVLPELAAAVGLTNLAS